MKSSDSSSDSVMSPPTRPYFVELAKECFLLCLEILHVVETDDQEDEEDEELLLSLDPSLELDVCESPLQEVVSSLNGP